MSKLLSRIVWKFRTVWVWCENFTANLTYTSRISPTFRPFI